MSIFTTNGYSLKYNLTHPWEVIMNWLRDIKCAWQRANKGYCYRDVWDIDRWFLRLIPQMIDEFIEIHHGYPSGMTDDEWVKILKEMSFHFKNADEDKTSFVNPYADKYISTMHFNDETKTVEFTDNEELQDNYHQFQKEKMMFIQKSFEDGMESFKKYFFNLWD